MGVGVHGVGGPGGGAVGRGSGVCLRGGGPRATRMLGPLPAGQVCHGAGGALSGPVLLAPG